MGSFSDDDRRHMSRALELARRGTGTVSPNPRVGAVLVKEGEIIGEGYHTCYGAPHAEAEALSNCKASSAQGSTLYVTLEPCSHTGKTPPCAETLIRAGVRRVVVGVQDPNPKVNGKGIERLKQAGVSVEVGCLAEACHELNETFFHYIVHKRPFVTLKLAATLDGRIAAPDGNSRWISCEESRHFVHTLRAESDGVLVGARTVLQDDPELTVRLVPGRNPRRIVLDANHLVPSTARVFAPHESRPTLRAISAARTAPPKDAASAWEYLSLPTDGDGHFALDSLLLALGQRQITSLLVEGGARLGSALLQEKLVDKLFLFVAPALLGAGTAAVTLPNVRGMGDLTTFSRPEWRPLGTDILFRGYPQTASSSPR